MTNPLSCLIIEDEPLAAGILEDYVGQVSWLHYVGRCPDALAATEALREQPVDAIFLDIHLPGLKGLDFLRTLTHPPQVILTTAYHEYALESYEFGVVDYLLKPISQKDLIFALEKFKKQQKGADNQLVENITAAYLQLNKQYKTRFLVKTGQSIDSIPTDEIHHFSTEESISFLTTKKGSRYAIDYTLDQLEKMLQPKDFFRINR